MKSDVGDVECLIKSHEFTVYGAVTEYLRGSWEYLRGCTITYGEAGSIYGGDLQFTGSCKILRGLIMCV